jgi:hypothetical protein
VYPCHVDMALLYTVARSRWNKGCPLSMLVWLYGVLCERLPYASGYATPGSSMYPAIVRSYTQSSVDDGCNITRITSQTIFYTSMSVTRSITVVNSFGTQSTVTNGLVMESIHVKMEGLVGSPYSAVLVDPWEGLWEVVRQVL